MAKLMDCHETMKYLKVARATFYRLVTDQRIPAVKVGGRWRIDKDRLNKWLRQNERVVWKKPVKKPKEL